jgi:uncharacterized membrane protein
MVAGAASTSSRHYIHVGRSFPGQTGSLRCSASDVAQQFLLSTWNGLKGRCPFRHNPQILIAKNIPLIDTPSTLYSIRNTARFGIRVVCTALVGGLLLAGIASVGASFVPFGFLLEKARGMSATGQIPFFSHDFYSEMQLRLRLIGAGNIAVAVALVLFYRQMCQFTEQVFADSLALGKDIKSAIRSVPAIHLVGLACLVLLAAFLRIPLLFQPMRCDEAYTFLQYSSHPFYVALSFYNVPNNHLFHTLLVRLAYLLFGNHPWALRLPVFLAGLCLVPATYIAARSLYRNDAALLAAGLVASSSVLIEYSTNARGYVIVCLVFVVLIPLAAYAVRHQNWADWCLLAFLSALGFYTIPILLYPFGGIVVWLMLSAATGDAQPNARSVVAGLLVAIGLTMLVTAELYLPVVAVSGPMSVVANKYVVATPLSAFLHGLPPSLASTWNQWNRDLPLFMTLALVASFFVCSLWHRRLSRFHVPLALALSLWTVTLVCVQRVVPFERVWLFALPLYFIMSTAGFAAAITPLVDRLRLRHVMMFVAITVSLFLGLRVQRSQSVYLSNEGRGLEALAVYLKGHLKAGDSVVAALPSRIPLLYYFQREGIPFSYVNAPTAERMLVLVQEASGDTVQRVLEMQKITDEGQPVKLMVKYDSATLYEVPPRLSGSGPDH